MRAGAPVISGCFAMALGLAPLLACQHEEARKFAIAISMLAACIGLWIGLFRPALFRLRPATGCPQWAQRSLRRDGSPVLRLQWVGAGAAAQEEDQEALSGVPASARRLPLPHVPFEPPTVVLRRPRRLEVVAAASANSLPRWPRRGGGGRGRCLVRRQARLPRAALSLLSGAASELPATSKRRPPTRRTLLIGTSLLARVLGRTQKHAARGSGERLLTGGGWPALARSFPSNLLAPAAAPDGGRQARRR